MVVQSLGLFLLPHRLLRCKGFATSCFVVALQLVGLPFGFRIWSTKVLVCLDTLGYFWLFLAPRGTGL